MIEIKNLGKVYKPKKGVPVTALADVNLTLGERGMVFLLGKSGSGKSTLLNLLGGLDAPSSGSFVVEGKSSEKFNQNDYDAYRNTYLGFIFQEYNILDEFTVGVNIGLALELQGKKATSAAINDILQKVDLVGYGNRKPNELSGGQKQRVAIARALIKDPRIIMADEPTGALDSNTGKAVFETLQKLSEEKLVIIVSHDRENAEIYADRIIELADGRVISDETKQRDGAKAVNVADKFVKGYILTDADARLIKDYISGTRVSQVQKFTFKETTKADIIVSKDNNAKGKMIASRLPIAKALKMGASPLKAKPIRLCFTILLCLVSFTLFGLVDTLACFNYTDAYYSAVEIGGYETGSLMAYEKIESDWGTYYNSKEMTEEEKDDALKVASGLASVVLLSQSFEFQNLGSSTGYSEYFSGEIKNMATLTEDDLSSFGYALTGSLPTEDDEVALSAYYFDQIQTNGITLYTVDSDSDEFFNMYTETYVDGEDIGTMTDFLALKPVMGNPYWGTSTYTITGFFDTGIQDDPTYATLKDGTYTDYSLGYTFTEERDSSLSGTMLVSQDVFDYYVEEKINSSGDYNGSYTTTFNGSEYWDNVSYIKEFDTTNYDIMFYDGSSLADDEILINQNTFSNMVGNNSIIVDTYDNVYSDGAINVTQAEYSYYDYSCLLGWISSGELYIPENLLKSYMYATEFTDAELKAIYYNVEMAENSGDFDADITQYFNELIGRWDDDKLTSLTSDQKKYTVCMQLYNNLWYYSYNDEDLFLELMQDVADYHKVIVDAELSSYFDDFDAQVTFWDETTWEEEIISCKIVGVFSSTSGSIDSDYNTIMANSNFYTVEASEPEIYKSVFFALPEGEEAIKAILALGLEDGNDLIYKTVTPSFSDFEFVYGFASDMTSVLFYVGLGFAVFAMLMMYNFMSVSIIYKRNEIGILRAIGSRGGDVFKIFFAESFIVSAINFVLASIATVVGAYFINAALVSNMGLVLNLLIVSVRQIALIFGISLLTAFIASFLPVRKIAKERPIDAIREK